MPKPRLHLDADTSIKALHAALLSRGHDVTGTPNDWMPLDASDEVQLLGATAQGRCIFTFNARDFLVLASRYVQHGGIVLAAQKSWTLTGMILALDRLLSETQVEDWPGQVRWLNEWLSVDSAGYPYAGDGDLSPGWHAGCRQALPDDVDRAAEAWVADVEHRFNTIGHAVERSPRTKTSSRRESLPTYIPEAVQGPSRYVS